MESSVQAWRTYLSTQVRMSGHKVYLYPKQWTYFSELLGKDFVVEYCQVVPLLGDEEWSEEDFKL